MKVKPRSYTWIIDFDLRHDGLTVLTVSFSISCLLLTMASRRVFYTVATAALIVSRTEAFAPPSTRIAARDGVNRAVERSVGAAMLPEVVADTTSIIHAADASAMTSSANLLSFSDQGQNLAGIFFQASLLPYLAFLYFLSFRGNRTPALGNFGWQYLLLFVLGTIPSGIVTKGAYGSSLANVDWLHGGAEALLTITNILIVLGFREAITNPDYDAEEGSKYGIAPKAVAGLAVLLFGTACAFGSSTFDVHSAFLGGVGNLPEDVVLSLPFVMHSEPDNALSIPTWAIHFSSVFEFLFAMDTIWKFADATDNPKWKGLTWGMLPLHASGIAACTYHFFYK